MFAIVLKMFQKIYTTRLLTKEEKKWNIYFCVDENRFEIYENDKRKTDFSFFLSFEVCQMGLRLNYI